MRYLIHYVRPAPALRAWLVVIATLVLAAACDARDQFVTNPVPPASRPRLSIVGADVVVLPTLGGPSTFAADINDAGSVIGQSDVTSTGTRHAVLWTASGGMQDLGTLGGASSEASSINEAGQVVGSSEMSVNTVRHAFLWTPGRGLEDLGTLGGAYSVARGINDQGFVVGSSRTTSGQMRPFLWTPGQGMQDLGTLAGLSGDPIAINNAGQIAGTFTTNGEVHAFLWTPGEGIRDLGTLGADGTVALALNEPGSVVGRTFVGPETRAFRWTPAEGMQDLGNLGAPNYASVAYDINDAGLVVGSSFAAPLQQHAFAWTTANGMEDLYAVTGMTWAAAVNNRGQVAGGNRVATLRFDEPGVAFATGSGFYALADRGKWKAHFTFNVNFLPGRSATPNGTLRFWVPGGQIEFESTVIEMLVVSGNRAQFWGTGILNGAAARFRITAVDGQSGGRNGSADAFRIELWQTGTLVFDTQPGAAQDAVVTTEIDGGNIQIHRD